jgi:hypothetical protein
LGEAERATAAPAADCKDVMMSWLPRQSTSGRPREGGDPVHRSLASALSLSEYWMPAFAGMTLRERPLFHKGEGAEHYDDLSQASVRFGQPVVDVA